MAGPLLDHLRRRIAAEGPITVGAFMTEVLLNPAHGTYATGDRLGSGGDFITAPEISQMFGELIGLWLVDTWHRIGAPDPVILAELGPGRGTLMADALRAARLAPAFRAALRLHLVEASPVYRRLQADTLREADPVWHETAGTLPDGPLLLVANEFFDALPIRQLQKTPQGWAERRVDADPESDGVRFVLDRRTALADLLVPGPLRNAQAGSVVELGPAGQAILRDLAAQIARRGGAALIIDYGYVGPRCGETLQAVRGHAPTAVLDAPGTADLSAHVDFGSLMAATRAAGAVPWGPVNQGDFLTALGIHARAARLQAALGPADAAAIDDALQRLIGSTGMGTLFQVMAVTGPDIRPPAGFAAVG